MDDLAAAGGDGFIVVDLPPEEGAEFVRLCTSRKLSYVPLLTPTTADGRLAYLGACVWWMDLYFYMSRVAGWGSYTYMPFTPPKPTNPQPRAPAPSATASRSRA